MSEHDVPSVLVLHAHVELTRDVDQPIEGPNWRMIIAEGNARVFAGFRAVAVADQVRPGSYVPGQPLPGLVAGFDYADIEGWSASRMEGGGDRSLTDGRDSVFNILYGSRAGTVLSISYTEGTRFDKKSGRVVPSYNILDARALVMPAGSSRPVTPRALLEQMRADPQALQEMAAVQLVLHESSDNGTAAGGRVGRGRRGGRLPASSDGAEGEAGELDGQPGQPGDEDAGEVPF
ncbi:MAG TPA: hypothetical protein VFS21_40310 [Roseiflexaceae bacterium]|nr:hypothetical protein [Roseiflexaceae bacterium]